MTDDPCQRGHHDQAAIDFDAYSDARLLSLPFDQLTTTQRERREALLAARHHQAPRQVGARRQPMTRRPRRAGRPETARMIAALPPHARVDRTMPDATARVYAALWRFADDGHDDPAVAAIAERAQCHINTVQKALVALKDSGHLVVTYRRVRPGMNATNLYQLTYHRGAVSTAAARGRNFSGVERNKDSGSTLEDGQNKGCSLKRSAPSRRAESVKASFDGRESNFQAIQAGAATTAQRRAGFTPETAGLAVAFLRCHTGNDIEADDFETICREIEQLRRRHFPGFTPRFWTAALRRLGFAAYLAVAEVIEIAAVKEIRDPTAYLGGILRKPADLVRPDITLTRLQFSAAA